MIINTNLSAQSGARLLADSSASLAKSLGRLSSGSKITSPEDDAAGLAVSMRLDSQVTRNGAAKSNVGNAISFSQTQDGFLQKVGRALDRMGELTILSQDATKSDNDRSLYDKEYQTLAAYVSAISGKDFNGVSLFNGASLNVTPDGDTAINASTAITLTGVSLGSVTYSSAITGSIGTTTAAVAAMGAIKNAITQVANDRATLGAGISRLNTTSDGLGLLDETLKAATSRIKDVDVAEESTRFARFNILVRAGTAMLAQANTVPQGALRLLNG